MLNESIFLESRIGRNRKTQKKQVEQTAIELEHTMFENNRSDFIQTANLPRI